MKPLFAGCTIAVQYSQNGRTVCTIRSNCNGGGQVEAGSLEVALGRETVAHVDQGLWQQFVLQRARLLASYNSKGISWRAATARVLTSSQFASCPSS